MQNGKQQELQMNAALQAIAAQRDTANNQVVQMAAAHAVAIAELQAKIDELQPKEIEVK